MGVNSGGASGGLVHPGVSTSKPSLKLLSEKVPNTATKRLRRALGAHLFSSLGFHSFVLPFERYKKYARYCNKPPSAAFGFDKYSDSDGTRLTEDYPKTIVKTWIPNELPPKSTWFTEMIRNSFAHGQITMTEEGGKLGIAIFNTRYPFGLAVPDEPGPGHSLDGVSRNFDVFIDLEDIGPLISTGLSNFIENVVDGRLTPLSTYLKNMDYFYK